MPSVLGDVTYTLNLAGAPAAISSEITASVQEAVALYNKHGSFNKHLNIYYNPGVPTAQSSYDGAIEFGNLRNTRTALHEMGHTMGIGQYGEYWTNMVNGVWQGYYGHALALEFGSPYPDGLHGDSMHIWPWGLNYDNEDSYYDRIKHVRMVAALRCDMGIMACFREAEDVTVAAGETASFRVEAPPATSYLWYRNGAPLGDGSRISGARTGRLQIGGAALQDEGVYHCALTGAGETLNSRPRRLIIERLTGRWTFDGDSTDSIGSSDGTTVGGPAYVAGRIDRAIDLDGLNDYVTLPPRAVGFQDITVATWVSWDGGADWQRIFDLGTGTSSYMFLTPRSGSGTLRLAFKDGWGTAEQIVETTALSTVRWVHVAAVLKGDIATLYVDGVARATGTGVTIHPIDFSPNQNYIGKSQYGADPLFNGRVDDFRVYDHGLTGAEIWGLGGDAGDAAPAFSTDLIELPRAVRGIAFKGQTLADHASDADDTQLTYRKIAGPAWLNVLSGGSLAGTPGASDLGRNTFFVRVTDPSGASSDAEVRIEVVAVDFDAGPLARWDFNDPALGARDGAGLPDSDGNTVWRMAAADKSGNGNHLTTWEYAWAGFNWSARSPQGDYSIVATGDYPACYTWSDRSLPSGADIESVALTEFTIEALFTVSGSGGFRTVVGRDGQVVSAADNNAATLYFGVDPGNHPLIRYADRAGVWHEVVAHDVLVSTDNAAYAIDPGAARWYHLAGVSDGDTLSLYLDGKSIGSTSVSATSTDTAMASDSSGRAAGAGWHAGGWSIARGLFAGSHTDRWYGYIDAVAISGKALAPGSFVIPGAGRPRFRRGDANADSLTDISDAVATLGSLFLGETKVPCQQAGDANDDGELDISDAVYVLSFLFLGGKAIPPPAGACGVDPTGHDLPCASFPGCQ